MDLSKLASFDQDVRFMGLNDLAAAVTHGTAPVDRSVIKAVATCMADTSADVQNEAIKVMALLAESGGATDLVVIETVNQKAPVAARGIALKQVFQRGVISAHTLQTVTSSELLENPVFQAVEGIDALIELLVRADIANSAADKLTKRLLQVLATKSSQLSVALPAIEAMALTVPHISESLWYDEVRPVIVANIDSPLYLGLIGKLAGNCDWLVPELAEKVLHHLDGDLNSVNHDVAEASIKAVAAFVLKNQVNKDRARQIAERALAFREFSDDSDGDGDASDDDDMYVDDDEDWYDESSGIRQAACQLAVALADSPTLVLDALKREHDEATRVAMYTALGSLGGANAIESQIARDIKRKRMVAADAGIKVAAEHGVSSRIILDMIKASKFTSHKYILLLDVQKDHDPETAKQILLPLFKEVSASEEVLLHAVDQAAHTKLGEFYEPVWSLLQRTTSTNLRAKILETLPLITTNPDQTLDAELEALQSPELLVAALHGISLLNNSGQISDYPRVITKLAQCLVRQPTKLCCDVLCAFPAEFSGSVAEALAGSTEVVESSFSESPHLLAQPAALTWAVQHSSEQLVHKIAKLPGKYEGVVSYCLNAGSAPEVIAAAVGAEPAKWSTLTSFYKFDTTPFAELGTTELVALKSLASWGCRWEWYSFEDMVPTTDLQSEVLGSITAITSGKATEDAERFSQLAQPFGTRAFVAYTKQLRDPSTAIQVMHEFPQLQSAEAAAAAILSERMLEVFLTKFESNPELVIETMKLVTGGAQVSQNNNIISKTLAQYVLDPKLSGKTRSDALATLRWIVQTVGAPINETLKLATAVLEPDASTVQIVNIGPFKHKVDSAAVLRQTALETILFWLPDSSETASQTAANQTATSQTASKDYIDAVVKYSLDDPEHEIKMVAFRLIGVLADLKISALKPFVPTIESKIGEKLAQKLKDTAVKQDVEKHTDLSRVMTDTLRKLHCL